MKVEVLSLDKSLTGFAQLANLTNCETSGTIENTRTICETPFARDGRFPCLFHVSAKEPNILVLSSLDDYGTIEQKKKIKVPGEILSFSVVDNFRTHGQIVIQYKAPRQTKMSLCLVKYSANKNTIRMFPEYENCRTTTFRLPEKDESRLNSQKDPNRWFSVIDLYFLLKSKMPVESFILDSGISLDSQLAYCSAKRSISNTVAVANPFMITSSQKALSIVQTFSQRGDDSKLLALSEVAIGHKYYRGDWLLGNPENTGKSVDVDIIDLENKCTVYEIKQNQGMLSIVFDSPYGAQSPQVKGVYAMFPYRRGRMRYSGYDLKTHLVLFRMPGRFSSLTVNERKLFVASGNDIYVYEDFQNKYSEKIESITEPEAAAALSKAAARISDLEALSHPDLDVKPEFVNTAYNSDMEYFVTRSRRAMRGAYVGKVSDLPIAELPEPDQIISLPVEDDVAQLQAFGCSDHDILSVTTMRGSVYVLVKGVKVFHKKFDRMIHNLRVIPTRLDVQSSRVAGSTFAGTSLASFTVRAVLDNGTVLSFDVSPEASAPVITTRDLQRERVQQRSVNAPNQLSRFIDF